MKRSSAELKQMARETLSGNYGIIIGAFVIYGVISMIAGCIPTCAFPVNSSYGTIVLRLLLSFLISLVLFLLYSGLTRIALSLCRRKPAKASDLFYCFTHHPDRFLVVGLIFTAISTVLRIPAYYLEFNGQFFDLSHSLLTLAATLIYTVLTLGFSMSVLLLIDHPDFSAMDALKESFSLMKGSKWRYFYIFVLSFMGLELLIVLSMGIGALWVLPYVIVTEVCFYLDLKGEV